MDKRLGNFKTKSKKVIGYASWAIVILLTISTVRNIERALNIKKQVQDERDKVAKMEVENAQLQTQINEAQGQDFIDKEIRDKLGLSKEGETIVVMPDEAILKSLAPPKETNIEILPDPNWKKWEKMFFEAKN